MFHYGNEGAEKNECECHFQRVKGTIGVGVLTKKMC